LSLEKNLEFKTFSITKEAEEGSEGSEEGSESSEESSEVTTELS
jgi:hypothetical protein